MTITAERPVEDLTTSEPVVTAVTSTAPPATADDAALPFVNGMHRVAANLCFDQAPDGCRHACPNGWGGDTERGSSTAAVAHTCAAARSAFGAAVAPSPRPRRTLPRDISNLLPVV